MKRVVIVAVAALLVSALAWAQAPSGAAAQSGNSPQAAPKPQQPPAPQQPAQQQPAAGQQPAAPAGPHQPQAKTQPEFNDFKQAVAIADLAAAENAASEFAAKYPDSELRAGLYQNLMNRYQQANNADKTVEMGRKVLQLDADNPVALVLVATVLAERTRETDLDRDEKLAEVNRDASRALQAVEHIALPPDLPPERAQAARNTVVSMAYSALGTADIAQENYAKAEQNLRKSVDVPGIEPDALTWLRLSISLDHQKKYPEALQAANRTVEIAQEPVLSLAKQERDRLAKLTGAPAAPSSTPQPGGSNPASGATPGATPKPAAPANPKPPSQQAPPPKN